MFRAVRRRFSSCGAQASPRGGFSCCVHGPWESQAAVVLACGLSGGSLRALEGKLSGWAAQAYLLPDMWDLPGPGIEPMSLYRQEDSQPLATREALYLVYLQRGDFRVTCFLLRNK